MGFKNIISFIFSGLLLVLAFQNCTKNPQVLFSGDPAHKAQDEDSGQSYDGKIFVTFGPMCSDFTEIQSRVVIHKSGRAEKNRQACQDIAPIPVEPSDYQIDPNDPTKLTLNNEVFTLVPAPQQGITNYQASSDARNFYYSYNYVGSPLFLRIYMDVDNSQSTGYTIAGLGIDYMIENDGVFRYSGSGGLDWSFTRIGGSNITNSAPHVQWVIPRSLIGSPLNFKNVANISNLNTFTEPIMLPNPSLTTPVGSSDNTNFYFSYNYTGTPTVQLFIDTDLNSSTGFLVMGAGADYLLEDGALYKFTGATDTTWKWDYVKDISMNKTSNSVAWAVPRSDLGSPNTLKFVGQVWVSEIARMLTNSVTQNF